MMWLYAETVHMPVAGYGWWSIAVAAIQQIVLWDPVLHVQHKASCCSTESTQAFTTSFLLFSY